jgi:hypothetical protein
MNVPLTVDIVQVLRATHRLYDASLKETDPQKSKDMARAADSGLSAAIPYIKDQNAKVMRKHYDAMQAMLEYEKGLE